MSNLPSSPFKQYALNDRLDEVANGSLSDGDFKNRYKVIAREAKDVWKVGKLLGLSADCDDELVIERLKELEAERLKELEKRMQV